MNTNNTKTTSERGSASRPEHRTSGRADNRFPIDYEQRQTNRNLPTAALLDLMKTTAPEFFAQAQVVGRWVWVEFAERQPREITARLAQLGFHWNNTRQLWQHPCGPVTVEASPDDPRAKYGAFRPATEQPA